MTTREAIWKGSGSFNLQHLLTQLIYSLHILVDATERVDEIGFSLEQIKRLTSQFHE